MIYAISHCTEGKANICNGKHFMPVSHSTHECVDISKERFVIMPVKNVSDGVTARGIFSKLKIN
jgi:hypothetical protein